MNEVLEKKRQLDKDITSLLTLFFEETGFVVTFVGLNVAYDDKPLFRVNCSAEKFEGVENA